MPIPFDQVVVHGTDSAAFSIYHPEDFSDRLRFPPGWENDAWLIKRDMSAGTIVIWCSGRDGEHNFRFTFGDLLPIEKKRVAITHDFRLRVSRGVVYFDNGDYLPTEDCDLFDPSADPDGCLELKNGNYRVTVTGLDWFHNTEPPDFAVPHFVIQFKKISSIEQVEVKTQPRFAFPDLRPSVEFHERYKLYEAPTEMDEESEPIESELKGKHPCVITDKPYSKFRIPTAGFPLNEYGEPDVRKGLRDLEPFIFVTHENDSFGLVCHSGSGMQKGDFFESFARQSAEKAKILSIEHGEPFAIATVEPYEVAPSSPSSELLQVYRDRLVTYFESEQYRNEKYAQPEYNSLRAKFCPENELLDTMLVDTYFLDQQFRFELEFVSEVEKMTRLIAWIESNVD